MNEDTAQVDGSKAPTITVDDIANAVQIIDYAADQGAFRGWKTIEQVLTVRARLQNFLEAAQAQQKALEEAKKQETENNS